MEADGHPQGLGAQAGPSEDQSDGEQGGEFGSEAGEVAEAAEAVRAENEALEIRLAEASEETERFSAEATAAREEAAAASARAEIAEAKARALAASMADKDREVKEANAALEATLFAKLAAEQSVRAREDEAAEAKATVKALRAEHRALETAAAEASAARAAAECLAAEARTDASKARSDALRESASAESAREACRRAEAAASRLAKHTAREAADSATTSPRPPPLVFPERPRGTSIALCALPAPDAETAAADALAAMSATAVAGSPLEREQFAEILREYTKRLRDDVAKARREVATHEVRASRMKAEIDRLASDLPSMRKAMKSETPMKLNGSSPLNVGASSAVASEGGDPSKASYYKSVAKKCYARMKSQKQAYELQIAGLRQQIELVSLPSLNTTNASFAATPTPRREKRRGEDDGGVRRDVVENADAAPTSL